MLHVQPGARRLKRPLFVFHLEKNQIQYSSPRDNWRRKMDPFPERLRLQARRRHLEDSGENGPHAGEGRLPMAESGADASERANVIASEQTIFARPTSSALSRPTTLFSEPGISRIAVKRPMSLSLNMTGNEVFHSEAKRVPDTPFDPNVSMKDAFHPDNLLELEMNRATITPRASSMPKSVVPPGQATRVATHRHEASATTERATGAKHVAEEKLEHVVEEAVFPRF